MRKHIFLFMLFIIAAQSYPQTPGELIRLTSQPVYSGLPVSEDGRGTNPSIIKVYEKGLVIWSAYGNKLVVIQNNRDLQFETYLEPPSQLFGRMFPPILYDSTNLGTTLIDGAGQILNWEGNRLKKLVFPLNWTNKNEEDIYPFNDKVFYLQADNNIKTLSVNPNDYTVNFYDQLQTRDLFTPGSTWSHPGLELDEKNRLIQNGEILTKDWDIFLDWMIEKNGTITRGGHAANLGISTTDGIGLLEKDQPFNPLQMKGWGLPFRGRDAHGNWYWDRLVFTPDGTLIENLQPYLESLPQRGYQGGLSAMVHPNGDFFYLFHDKGIITLYKIENTWSPEAKMAYQEGLKKGLYKMPEAPATAYRAPNGTVLEDGVRVRWNPNTQDGTGINTSLKKETVVQILARTQTKESISGREAFWYAVKTSEGVYGWSFGAFIQVPEPDKVMVGSGYFGPYVPPRDSGQ